MRASRACRSSAISTTRSASTTSASATQTGSPSEDPSGRGVCRSYHMRLEALYRSGRLRGEVAQFFNGIDTCVRGRRAAASERDAHVHRALVHRRGPQSRRHRAAEPVLRRNARLALSTRSSATTNRNLAVAYRNIGDRAAARQFALRAIGDERSQSQYIEPRRERVSPAVPARAGSGRREAPRSPITRSTRPPTRVTSTTSARARSRTSARSTRPPRIACRSTRSTSRTKSCSCNSSSARRPSRPAASTSHC